MGCLPCHTDTSAKSYQVDQVKSMVHVLGMTVFTNKEKAWTENLPRTK